MTTLLIVATVAGLLILTVLVLVFSIKFSADHSAPEKSWHLKLFRAITFEHEDYRLPSNICVYFWRYVLHILFIPWNILMILYGVLYPKQRDESGVMWTISTIKWFLLLLSFGIGSAFRDGLEFHFWKSIGIGLAVLSSAALLIIIIFGLLHLINKAPKDTLLTTKISSWKDRNCPMINWE